MKQLESLSEVEVEEGVNYCISRVSITLYCGTPFFMPRAAPAAQYNTNTIISLMSHLRPGCLRAPDVPLLEGHN